MLGLGE
jgi:tryptophan synthase beta subunit